MFYFMSRSTYVILFVERIDNYQFWLQVLNIQKHTIMGLVGSVYLDKQPLYRCH
jgi:hypothetical protein